MDMFKIEAQDASNIVIERMFKADVEAVVKTFLEPDLVMQWMSGPDMPMEAAEIDPRPAGGFRYVWGAPDGQKMTLTGSFVQMEVADNGDRLIEHTELFDPDWTGGQTLVRTDYLVQAGGTLVRTTVTYGSSDVRDAALASEMGAALRSSYDRLDKVLAAR
jgi:uncharacterized protein YndB with AHSA1/START domain